MSLTAAMMKMMNAMSLGQYPSMNGSSAMTGVKQMRTSVMMLGSVHMVPRLPQRLHDVLTDTLERVEDSISGESYGLEIGCSLHPVPIFLTDQKLRVMIGVRQRTLLHWVRYRPAGIERRLELGNRGRVRQVTFVVLN